jgi:Co/Zn/Cd efflux system component
MLLFASLGLVMNTAAMRKARKRYKMEPMGLFLHVLRKTLPP